LEQKRCLKFGQKEPNSMIAKALMKDNNKRAESPYDIFLRTVCGPAVKLRDYIISMLA